MLSRIRPRLSYANVVSTIALFSVLGGGAYAHHRNSVGPQQLQRDAVKKRHIDRNAVATQELRPRSVRPRIVAPNAIRPRHIFDGAITEEKLADGVAVAGAQGPPGPQGDAGPRGPQGEQGPPGSNATIDGVAAGGDLTGTYPNPLIDAGAVGPGKLANLAVTMPKIDAAAVTTEKLADESVTAAKIDDSEVQRRVWQTCFAGQFMRQIHVTGAATCAQVNPGTGLEASNQGQNRVLSISDEGIDTDQIADDAVTTDKLGSSAVTNEKLANSSVTSAKVQTGSLRRSDFTTVGPAGSFNPFLAAHSCATNEPSTGAGSSVGDDTYISVQSIDDGFVVFPMRVATEDTLRFRVCNITASSGTPNLSYSARLIRP